MGGIVDTIFGDEPETKVRPQSRLAPEQRELLQFLTPILQQRVEEPVETGQFTDAERLSLDALEQMVTGFATSGGPEQATETATGALTDIIGQGPRDIDQFFTETVQRPLLEDFPDVIDATRNRFQGSGNLFSGERRESEAQAREDLFDALTRERANIAFTERGQDLDRSLRAAGVLPSLSTTAEQFRTNQLLSLIGGATSLGEAERGTTRTALDERNRRIREVLGALGIPAQENVVVNKPGQQGLLQQAGSSFAQAAPFFFL